MSSAFATGAYSALAGAGALGLAWGGFLYASLWPTSQIFGKTLTAPKRPGELALTFDDGPNPAWTPRLLDILAEHKVRATFFTVGRFAQAEPGLVRRAAAAGHLIGNHTWSHPNLARTSAKQIREELARTNDALAQILGKPVRFFRPPYGARRPYALRCARDLGLVPVTWNAMTTDWSEPSADRIAARLMSKIDANERQGFATNIVLHDGHHAAMSANRGPSVGAATQIVARYAETHRFVTLDAWA